MRMICPNCGLHGTAADEHYQKKVQCPDCLKVFTAAGDVLVDQAPWPAEMGVSPDIEVSSAGDAEKNTGAGASADLVSAPDDTDILLCEACGFRFSSDFIRIIDGRQICPVCAN